MCPSYSGPHCSLFGLNIQSEWGKIRIRITTNTENFCAVYYCKIDITNIWHGPKCTCEAATQHDEESFKIHSNNTLAIYQNSFDGINERNIGEFLFNFSSIFTCINNQKKRRWFVMKLKHLKLVIFIKLMLLWCGIWLNTFAITH